MSQPRYFLLTGTTSGLGLEAAAQLAAADSVNIIIAGVREEAKLGNLRRAVPPAQLHIMALDISSLSSVQQFAANVVGFLGTNTLSAMALNAGVQIVSGDRYSEDGFELTFATNVLGHIALFQHLQTALTPGAVIVSTASGTHDKNHKLAKPYKFYGGYFPSAAEIASGNVSSSSDQAQLGRDRYATSKLCNLLFTYAKARGVGLDGPRFIAYDPGLMPGTELARDQPAAMRFAWKNLLPVAAKMIDGASTAERSGRVLAELLMAKRFPSGTGLHIEFTGDETPSSQMSYDEALQDQLMRWAVTNIFRINS